MSSNLDKSWVECDPLIENTIKRSIQSVINEVHESGCGLGVLHRDLTLADDADGQRVG